MNNEQLKKDLDEALDALLAEYKDGWRSGYSDITYKILKKHGKLKKELDKS